MISAEKLRELFHYDAETGRFTRRVFRSHNAQREAESALKTGYLSIQVNKRNLRAHRMAWLYVYGELPPKGVDIDHINGDRTDNRICNLRLASRSQNMANVGLKGTNSSGFKGVSWHKKSQRWRARIKVDYREIYLGSFDSPEEAHAAYAEAVKRYFGAFGRV